MWMPSLRTARRVAIAIIGSTILLIGIALLFTPFPGLLVILGGLSILAVEFAWARVWLKRVKDQTARAKEMMREAASTAPPPGMPPRP